VACDGDGLPVFERLRYRRQDARVFLYAFDLLELNGLDLRREPLELRRRPRKLTPHQRQEALRRLHAGETMADVARTYAVDASTISRLAQASPFGQSAVGL
jgi:ATP-dependent DNA ligase